jgi:hypothetical protein
MSAKKKQQAIAEEQVALMVAHDANRADDEAEASEETEGAGEPKGPDKHPDQEVDAILRYLRQRSHAKVKAAYEVREKEVVGELEKELEELEAAVAAKKALIAAANGEEFTEGKNPAIKRARGPNRPKEGAPTIDQVVAYLKNEGATSAAKAVRKGGIVSHLQASAGQWAKVIKDALASKRVATDGRERPMTAYYATGK